MAPKGLKAASKKKRSVTAAFDPTATVAAAVPSATTSSLTSAGEASVDPTAEDGEGRTMPLDGDRLSVSDLFELKRSATELLATEDEEKIEEARGLLRGILHGSEDLLALIPDQFNEERATGMEKAKDEGPEKKDEISSTEAELRSLGLDGIFEGQQEYRDGRSQLYYLQAWALHEYGIVLSPAESLAQNKIASDASGRKRRKVDLAEPRNADEWLRMAQDKYTSYVTLVVQNKDTISQFDVLVVMDAARCSADRARLALKSGDQSEVGAIMTLPQLQVFRRSLSTDAEIKGTPLLSFDDTMYSIIDMCGDLNTTILQTLSVLVPIYETLADNENLILIDGIATELRRHYEMARTDPSGWVTAEMSAQWFSDTLLLQADVALARFVVRVEEIERKYRPDAEETEEGDVEPLPRDAPDVEEAKEDGERTVVKIKEAIEEYSKLPSKKQSAESRTEQYQKLEEAYLMYSALFNPDEVDEQEKIEETVDQIRKEGGLDEVKA